MSTYQPNDSCQSKNLSYVELEDDQMHGSLNRDACVLPSKDGQKFRVTKSMVFEDINILRFVLKNL